MQSIDFQSLLFNGDLLLLGIVALAILLSIRKKEQSCLLFALIFLVVLGARHYLVANLSQLPIDEMRFWWFQSFLYLFFGAFTLSLIIHASLFIRTNKVVLWSYRLMTINVICYAFMHIQKNELNITEPNWTHSVYTATVVPINYIIALLLVFGAKGSKQNAAHA